MFDDSSSGATDEWINFKIVVFVFLRRKNCNKFVGGKEKKKTKNLISDSN